MSRYFKAEVISNLTLNNNSNLLTIAPLQTIIDPKPGQFYMIEVGNSYDPLLKRPFSFFRKIPEGIQFLYRVRGRGTMLLKSLKDGAIINVLGPFGNKYPETESGKIPLLIVGGIGIASLFSLAEAFSKRAYVLYGARDKDELFMSDELKGLTDELIISTDDGSIGEKGMISDVLNDFLIHHSSLITHCLLYACGPKPMLEAISRIAINNGIKGYVSLEENMACGFGACLGCAVKVRSQESNPPESPHTPLWKRDNPPIPPLLKGGEGGLFIKGGLEGDFKGGRGGITNSEFIYKRVCKEGPVFPIEEIVWE